MKAVLLAMKLGGSFDQVSETLWWKDFVAYILSENNFITHRTIRFRQPRIEIDVLAVKDGLYSGG